MAWTFCSVISSRFEVEHKAMFSKEVTPRMTGTDKWSTTMKGCFVENDPSVMVKVVVPHGAMFLPSAFTSLV